MVLRSVVGGALFRIGGDVESEDPVRVMVTVSPKLPSVAAPMLQKLHGPSPVPILDPLAVAVAVPPAATPPDSVAGPVPPPVGIPATPAPEPPGLGPTLHLGAPSGSRKQVAPG